MPKMPAQYEHNQRMETWQDEFKEESREIARTQVELMQLILKKLRLLNAMFDEAFDTKIHIGDIFERFGPQDGVGLI